MVKAFIIRNKYWITVLLTYFSIIYSTSLHHFYGVERTVSLAYFVQSEKTLEEFYPDIGALKGLPIDIQWRNIWKVTSFAWDSGYYLAESHHIERGIAPYKYRILPIMLVYGVSYVLQISREMSFVLLNIFVITLSAILFNIFLVKGFQFSKRVSFIGGILLITTVTVTSTLPFPMLDPISILWAVLIFMAVKSRNVKLFLLFSIAGVLSKEVLIMSSFMWFFETFQLRDKHKIFINLLIISIPIIVFSSVRMLLGGQPFEVEFGHNLLKGDFPILLRRFIEPAALLYIAKYVFLSHTFLWLGLINIKKNDFFKRQILIIPLVIFAAVSFSAQVCRPLGVLSPLVIPMFLYFFEDPALTHMQE